MNILVIHGSPHDGNTLKLTRKFEEAMKTYGDIRFEYLNVRELNLEMCRGCFNCITRGEDLCPIRNDDLKLVLGRMDAADGVVVSAPTYMFSVPAVMKNLIDRLSYIGHRPRYLRKSAVVISTTCGAGLKEALRYLSFSTAGAWGFRLAGTLGAETHPFYLDATRRKKLNGRIAKLARKFHKALARKEPLSAGFEEMMRFRFSSLHGLYAKKMFTADYRFYHENSGLGKNYYLKDAKIGFFAAVASGILAWLIGRSMRKSGRKADMNRKFLD